MSSTRRGFTATRPNTDGPLISRSDRPDGPRSGSRPATTPQPPVTPPSRSPKVSPTPGSAPAKLQYPPVNQKLGRYGVFFDDGDGYLLVNPLKPGACALVVLVHNLKTGNLAVRKYRRDQTADIERGLSPTPIPLFEISLPRELTYTGWVPKIETVTGTDENASAYVAEFCMGGDLATYFQRHVTVEQREPFLWHALASLLTILVFLHHGWTTGDETEEDSSSGSSGSSEPEGTPARRPIHAEDWDPIIHADMTGNNIYVQLSDNPRDLPQIRLGDWGLASRRSRRKEVEMVLDTDADTCFAIDAIQKLAMARPEGVSVELKTTLAEAYRLAWDEVPANKLYARFFTKARDRAIYAGAWDRPNVPKTPKIFRSPAPLKVSAAFQVVYTDIEEPWQWVRFTGAESDYRSFELLSQRELDRAERVANVIDDHIERLHLIAESQDQMEEQPSQTTPMEVDETVEENEEEELEEADEDGASENETTPTSPPADESNKRPIADLESSPDAGPEPKVPRRSSRVRRGRGS